MIKTPSSEQPPPPPSKPPDNGDSSPSTLSPASSINPDLDGEPSSSSSSVKSAGDKITVDGMSVDEKQSPQTDGVQTRARTNPTPISVVGVTTANTSQESSSSSSISSTSLSLSTTTTSSTTTSPASVSPSTSTTSTVNTIADSTVATPSKDDAMTTATTTETKKPKQKKTVTFKNVLETSDDIIVKRVYNPDGAPLVPIIKKECLARTQRYFKSECLVRPSRLTEILKNNANNIDKLNSITFRIPTAIPPAPTTSTPTTLVAGLSPSIISTSTLLVQQSSVVATTSSSSSAVTSPKPGEKSDVIVGDKRFVLPKRSVHSCRVIKPNKRFLDGMDDTYNKRHLKRLNKFKTEGGDVDEGKGGGEESDENVREDEESITSKSVSDEETDDSSSVDASEKSTKMINTTNLPSPSLTSSAGKVILRQPKLTFSSSNTLNSTTSTDGPFSLNINSINHTNSLGK